MEKEFFPDGTPIAEWFYQTEIPSPEQLGRPYPLDQYGVPQDGKVHTQEIQQLIDRCAEEGGGVIVVPPGVWMSGSLYFRQGVNLYVSEGGVLMGSDDVSDYDIKKTRIEGQTCNYFTALINAEGVKGFTMCGPGVIDGNGLRSWKAFWLRRRWNPKCTNKDEQRPRLVYISDSSDVLIAGLTLQNSHFWTTHLYRCQRVKYIGCRITSPAEPVKAPSTDAIDIDVCSDILVKDCYMEVNDDSVVLKGGKGPWADTAPENGGNERILVEDCTYGFCHGVLTCGSESVYNRNVLVRRIRLQGVANLLVLKMRPDTPQRYEYITVEQARGRVGRFLNINPWIQFYDLGDRKDIPLSYAEHITFRECEADCRVYLHVAPKEDQYRLTDFAFRDLKITAENPGAEHSVISGAVVENVTVNGVMVG
ncbi:MAG: exopolygalacturonase [Clostridia bacterium]|nr:exopolygalacturonase [Clostridia bacterium]